MDAFATLLLGTCLILLGLLILFAYLWWREIDRRYLAERQRDNLRGLLRHAAHDSGGTFWRAA